MKKSYAVPRWLFLWWECEKQVQQQLTRRSKKDSSFSGIKGKYNAQKTKGKQN